MGYQQPSRWTRYRWHILGGGALIVAGGLLIAGNLLQRTVRRRAEASLAERLRFERLLAEVSARLIRVPARDMDAAIERELRQVVQLLGVDRASLHEYRPGGATVRFSWAVDGIVPPSSFMEVSQLPWTTRQLERGAGVQFSRLDDLPAEAASDRPGYQQAGTQSCLAIPLQNGRSVLGVLFLDSVRGERTWPDALVRRIQLLSEVLASVLERKRAELSLDEQLRFETLLSEQSAAFSRLSGVEVDREIEQGLRQIAEFLEVDRGSLVEFSQDRRTARITHTWSTEGAEPPPAAVALEELPWVMTQLRTGEMVRFSRPEDLPPEEAAVDRRTYARLGIRSRIEIPLMVEGTVVGALSFSTLGAERAWRDELVQRLRLLGEVFANVLSRRRSEMETLRLRQDLAHVGRVSTLGELTASLAHELNQPLTTILSNAEAAQGMLAADPENLDEVREILQDIVEADKRASDVIHRLRGLLRKGPLEFSTLDLNGMVDEVARLVTPDAVMRDVWIRLELASELPPVRGDRVQLQQVLLNLILNGLDAMREAPPGSRNLVVRTARDGPAAVQVAVQDSGVGIDLPDVDHIFDAFYTTKPKGIGMGLAIARSIVQAHGGRLEAENNPDGGVTLSFTLPLGEEGR